MRGEGEGSPGDTMATLRNLLLLVAGPGREGEALNSYEGEAWRGKEGRVCCVHGILLSILHGTLHLAQRSIMFIAVHDSRFGTAL